MRPSYFCGRVARSICYWDLLSEWKCRLEVRVNPPAARGLQAQPIFPVNHNVLDVSHHR